MFYFNILVGGWLHRSGTSKRTADGLLLGSSICSTETKLGVRIACLVTVLPSIARVDYNGGRSSSSAIWTPITTWPNNNINRKCMEGERESDTWLPSDMRKEENPKGKLYTTSLSKLKRVWAKVAHSLSSGQNQLSTSLPCCTFRSIPKGEYSATPFLYFLGRMKQHWGEVALKAPLRKFL